MSLLNDIVEFPSDAFKIVKHLRHTRTTTPVLPPRAMEQTYSPFVQQLAQVSELALYGAIVNSSKRAQLTENEAEDQVLCVKQTKLALKHVNVGMRSVSWTFGAAPLKTTPFSFLIMAAVEIFYVTMKCKHPFF